MHIYSTYTYVNQAIKAGGYETEIISGIPSFCAGAAKAQVSLCEGNETLAVIPSIKMNKNMTVIIMLLLNTLKYLLVSENKSLLLFNPITYPSNTLYQRWIVYVINLFP